MEKIIPIGQMIPPNQLADFLKSPMIDLKLFILDWWSPVHLFSGAILGYYLKKWWHAFVLLIIYELFEILFYGVLFSTETIGNRIQDIIVGMIGYFIARKFSPNK